jgi:predicted RNase H-like HicB family nuclease
MSTADAVRLSSQSTNTQFSVETFEHEAVLRCDALLSPEETGFSIHCLNLPGVVSQGETEAEAVENIKDAFRETVLYYRESHQPIPWGNADVERTPGSRTKFVIVRI